MNFFQFTNSSPFGNEIFTAEAPYIALAMCLKPSPSGFTISGYTFVMEHYRTGAHTRYDIKYHFVWVTKYRKRVLTGAVSLRVRDLVREICRTNEIEIL